MKSKSFLLATLMLGCFTNFTYASVTAGFTYSSVVNDCSYLYTFTDQSSGDPTKWTWYFGDGESSTFQNTIHIYSASGTYQVMLVAEDNDGNSDTAIKQLTINIPSSKFSYTPVDTVCSNIMVSFANQTPASLSYVWDFGDGEIYYGKTPPAHNYKAPGEYNVSLIALSTSGCPLVSTQSIKLGAPATILASTKPATLNANYECTDEDGWTNYFYDNNTPNNSSDDKVLLSLQKNGNDIGTVNDGSFLVTVAATTGAGSNKAIALSNPLITNTSGFWVMNRYWKVQPTTQPVTPVGVRFYFNTQDLNDLNGSYPSQDLSFTDLLMYNINGGNPDPQTNLSGANKIVSVTIGSDADTDHWVYTELSNGNNRAEFLVNNLTGGGGGLTGNKQTLPVKLISFAAKKLDKNFIQFNWQTASEINTDRFEIERSYDGRNFHPFCKVNAAGNTSGIRNYSYSYQENIATASTIFYRLRMIDKDGKNTTSKIISIKWDADNKTMKISPNPVTNGFAKVMLGENYTGNITAVIYNTNGVRVKEITKRLQQENNFSINISNLSLGQYKVMVFGNSQKLGVQSLVIIR